MENEKAWLFLCSKIDVFSTQVNLFSTNLWSWCLRYASPLVEIFVEDEQLKVEMHLVEMWPITS